MEPRSNSVHARPRRGQSAAECLIALALLVPITTLVAKIGWQSDQAMESNETTRAANRSILNAMEQTLCLKYEDVTPAAIESLSVEKTIATSGWSTTLQASIIEIAEPIESKQVTIGLLIKHSKSGEMHEGTPLTFWVVKP
jgi:hypothetical protein